MNCKKCGSALGATDVVCPMCGEPVNGGSIDTPIENNQGAGLNPGVDANPNVGVNPMMNNNQNMGVNPMMNNNQNMGMNPNMNYQEPKKKSNVAFIVIIAVLALAIVGIILFLVFGRGDQPGGGDTTTTTTTTTQKPTGVVTPGNSTTTIVYNGYTFTVPTGYVASTEDNMLSFIDSTNKVLFVLNISNFSYDMLVQNAEEVKGQLVNQGLTVTSYGEKTYGGRKWYVYSGSYQGKNVDDAYTALGSYTVEAAIYNVGGKKTTDQVYGDANSIISSAKNSGTSSFAASAPDGKISVNSGVVKADTSKLK